MEVVDAIIERLQAHGERMTMPRRLVIDALGGSHEHLTIGDIQQHILSRSPDYAMSDTTVYRVLQWLKELELVSQTDMGQTGVVYALLDAPHHHHLICLSCGKTFTVEDDLFTSLRDRLRHDVGFEARIDHMAIYGKCRDCLERENTATSASRE